jgi:hypothetical protein
MMAVASRRARLPPRGVSRLEARPDRLPRLCIPSKLHTLALRFDAYFVLSTRARNPRWTVASMVPLLTVFDVKENVRVTPISSYDQRCVVLPFHTIVDAPWPPRCSRA